MTALHNRRDTLLNDIDALVRLRDGIWAMYAQLDDCNYTGEQDDVSDALATAGGEVSESIMWLREDVIDIEDRMPRERPYQAMVL